MKKTKPVKGSARAKKFDAGGLAALAGLGALAYMMRKKKGESEGSAPKDKSGYSSGPVDVGRMIEGRGDEEPSAEVKRAMAASKGRPDLIPEGATDADKATMYGDTVAKRVMPAPRRAAKLKGDAPLLPPKKGETRISTQISPPAGNESRPSKPYPKDVKGTTPSTYYTPSARSAASMIEGSGESRKQRLGATYAKQYSAYQNAPAGADKEALKKSMEQAKRDYEGAPLKRGGAVKASKMGTVKQAKPSMGSASKRADGIAQRGKTRGRIC
jgi:hypothetical protein